MLRATLDEPVTLAVQLSDGDTGKFARVRIFDSAGSVHVTLGTTHVSNGLYTNMHTFTTEGFYTAVYQVFDDAGFVTPSSEFDIEAETIEVNSDKTNIIRTLGLLHHNTQIDSHSYNDDKQLLSARVRQYDSKANAELAGATGLLNTWTVTSTYGGGLLTKYVIVREP